MFFSNKKKKKRRDSCNHALDSAKNLLPPEVADNIDELMNEHNEWGVGIEMLIDCLAEQDARINQAQYGALQAALVTMDLEHEDRMLLLDELLEG